MNKKSRSVPSLPYPFLYSTEDKHQGKIAVGFPKGSKHSANTHPSTSMQPEISWEFLRIPLGDFNTFASSGISNIHKQMTQVAQETG